MSSSSRSLVVDAGLTHPATSPRKGVAALVEDGLKRRAAPSQEMQPIGAAWNSAHFQLEGVSFFEQSTENQKSEILRLCSRAMLEEAFFIEKAGLAYDAKLTLLADNTQERMMYSLFAADEAAHLSSVMSFLPSVPAGEGGPFLKLLGSVIETADAHTLSFVVQVVLEGWGITHYRNLARHTQVEALRIALEQIALDETRHHGSGLVLFNSRQSKKMELDAMQVILRDFLGMVQCGPQTVAHVVDQVLGGLTQSQKIKLMEELNAGAHSAQRLDVLKGLMRTAHAGALVEQLEAKGCFVAWTPAQCAEVMG